MPSASLALPFAILPADVGKRLSPEMEVAAVLYWTEEKRRQRRFLNATEKRVVSLSKLHYPLWAVPWENASLIVDGLDILSSTVAFQTLPDVIELIDDVDRGTSVRARFNSALAKHEKAFGEMAKIEQIQVAGLVSNTELLLELRKYIKETAPLALVGKDRLGLIPEKLDRETAVQRAQRIPQLQKQIFSEIRSVEYAVGLLGRAAGFHEEMILKEAELTRESYEAEVNKLRPSVDEKVDKLVRDLDARIMKMSGPVNKELAQKERERQRLERELQRSELGKADHLKRRDTRKQKHDTAGAAHWENRMKFEEARIEETRAKISHLEEFVEKTRAQNRADVERLRQNYQWLIDQEKRKILDIELQRDSMVALKQKEIDQIKNKTASIKREIEDVIQRKRDQETRLKRLAMPWTLDEPTLICVPFYLAHYQIGDKTEFQVSAPSIVTRSQGIVRTLQKTLRSLGPAPRTALPLQPRSKALNKMLDSVIIGKTESDEAFRDSLSELATSNNILAMPNFRDILTKGVEELKAERWIGPKEADVAFQAYI